MKRYKFWGTFFISTLALFLLYILITKSQFNTEDKHTIYEQTAVSQNEGLDFSISNSEIQRNISQNDLFESELKKNVFSLLKLGEESVVIEKTSETQFKISIDEDLGEREYISLCNLLNTLKYYYYPNDTISILLELPNETKEIIPINLIENVQNNDENVIS